MSTIANASNGHAIFVAPYVEVYINKEENTLLYKWIGPLKDEDALEGMNLITENIRKHSLRNMIADLSEFKGGSVNVAKWINDIWSEKLKAAGLQKLSVNEPVSSLGDFSNKLAQGAKTLSLLQIRKFTTLADAYNWFKSSTSQASASS